MSSACVPAYLLARGLVGHRWALLAAFLTISVPWMLYSSFLLTEVAAYPAFMWAVLGVQRCVVRPSRTSDALALAGLLLAFLARTQFIVLVLVPPLAIVAFELVRHRRVAALRAHAVLAVGYAAVAAACLVLLVKGELGSILGAYGTSVHGDLLPTSTGRSLLQHLATLALGLGLVPVIVGGGWLVDCVRRRQASSERQAFACLSLVATVVVIFEVTVYDLRLGVGLAVNDRYLFYLAPIYIIAVLCAVTEPRMRVFGLALFGVLVASGFALDDLPRFQWAQFATLDADAPVAGFYRPLAHLFGGLGYLRAGLAVTTLLLTGLYAVGTRVLRPPYLAGIVVVLMLTTIPLATWYDVNRVITKSGGASRPITGAANGTSTLGWVDKAVGDETVTEVPYHVSSDYLVNLRFWLDLEFWNKSVLRNAQYPSTGDYAYTGGTFPKTQLSFDPVTGRSSMSPSRWVVQAVTESRFRIAGTVALVNGGAMLIDAERPWRLAWATVGPNEDGWLKPNVPARIRVYPSMAQTRPRVLYVNLQVRAPNDVAQRPFVVRSNLKVGRNVSTAGATVHVNAFPVCVPPGRFATVEVGARGSSTIPGDLSGTYAESLGTREGSIYLADTSVSDDVGPPCRISPRGT
jgi:hypothetical protein